MVTLSVMFAWFALSQTPIGDQAALQRLEVEWNDAHVQGDGETLGRLYGDDIVVVVPGMRVLTKSEALAMFASGRMKFDRYETSETTFRIYENTAVVTGRLRRTRIVGGAKTDDDWRFTKVYVRRTDRWQVVSFHASNTAL